MNRPSGPSADGTSASINKKQAREAVHQRLSLEESKTAVFNELSGHGVSDRVLANMIASYASPQRCRQHAKWVDAVIVVSWLQLAAAMLMAVAVGLGSGWVAFAIMAAIIGAVGYLFVWGFTHNRAWAYHVTIMMTLVNLPKALTDVGESPLTSIVGLLLGLAWLALTWYVRRKLFPDFTFIAPTKVKGRYVFST